LVILYKTENIEEFPNEKHLKKRIARAKKNVKSPARYFKP
jgi:hypothetical protein